MARGRFVDKSIVLDKAFNSLASDGSRLAWILAMLHADVEGRLLGDPVALRSILFPRRQDVTAENMAEWIEDWQRAGLVICYNADNEDYLHLTTFDEHQQGLRKDREAASKIPECPKELLECLQSNSGVTPESLPLKFKYKYKYKSKDKVKGNDPTFIIENSGQDRVGHADAETSPVDTKETGEAADRTGEGDPEVDIILTGCKKCKAEVEMVNPKKTVISGKNVLQGKCKECGGKVFRFKVKDDGTDEM